VESLQSGIVYGFASQVEGIVRRMARELSPDDQPVTVIATGGWPPWSSTRSAVIDTFEPWLTLSLAVVYERNAASQTGAEIRLRGRSAIRRRRVALQ